MRDFLLGRKTKDHDIATSATPDKIEKIFPNALTVGKHFGVLKVPFPSGLVEIATFRKDLEYMDHRHPKRVIFSDPHEDARRRDFTVNALFYDVKTSRIADFVHGLEDLRVKRLRAIGEPDERFEEDALRLLRAVRFAVTLGFTVEPRTLDAIRKKSRLIARISAERVRGELERCFIDAPAGDQRAVALQMLHETGLLVHVLPELERLRAVAQSPVYPSQKDLWSHLMTVLALLPATISARLAWAALLHSVGKPSASRRSSGQNFNNHEVEGSKAAKGILERLKMPAVMVAEVSQMVLELPKFEEAFEMREATLMRWIRQPYFADLLALHRVESLTADGDLAAYEFCQTRLEELPKTPARVQLIDGEDLIQLGFNPGPRFAEILKEIEDLAIEGKLLTKNEALEFVLKHFT